MSSSISMSSKIPSLLLLCTQFWFFNNVGLLSTLTYVISTVRSTWIAGLLVSLNLEDRGIERLALKGSVVAVNPNSGLHFILRNKNWRVGTQATNMPTPASTMPQYTEVVTLTVLTLEQSYEFHGLYFLHEPNLWLAFVCSSEKIRKMRRARRSKDAVTVL